MIQLMNRRRGQKGFTLIELLIVVAIIGIIAAILIPNLLDALQKAKQKRTVADMRDVGTSWFSWLTDQVGAASAGANTYDFTTALPNALDGDGLLGTLYVSATMFYIQEVPMSRMSATVLFCLAFCRASSRLGIRIAAIMPMIATTMRSSMRVKPFWPRRLFII